VKPGPSGPLRLDWRQLPAPSRLPLDRPDRDEILTRHDRALASGMSTYLDPTSGWIVFTANYLAERGYCCSAGCRHCPWVDARFDA
jgi:Family of unknown function (DUF5522)